MIYRHGDVMNALLMFAVLAFSAPDPVTAGDFTLQRMDDFEYAEAWYLVAQTDGGARISIVSTVTNTGINPFTATVDASLIYPDGRIVSEKMTIPRKEIVVSANPFGMRFGADDSFSLALDRSRFQFHGKKLRLDLDLETLAKGYKFGDGKTLVAEGGKFFTYHVLTPRGRLTGEAVAGGNTLKINGFGYLDHTRQNIASHKFIDRVYSFRAFSADEAVTFHAFIGNGEVKASGLAVTRGDRVVLVADRLKLAENNPLQTTIGPRYLLPSVLQVSPVKAGFTLTKMVQERDVLDDLNFFERKFINLFVARPMLFRYWASYEIPLPDGTVAKGTGLAEAAFVRVR
jgi:hypothetical protein